MRKIKRKLIAILVYFLRPVVMKIMNSEVRVWGRERRLKLSPNAFMANTLFNTISGNIEVGDYTFAGHNVCIITGTHDYQLQLKDRVDGFPKEGRDIVIGRGVWIGSNSTILGPCIIEDHAVVAAGALVPSGAHIKKGEIVVGIPAKAVRVIEFNDEEAA